MDSLQIYHLYTVDLRKVSEYDVISINQRSHMTIFYCLLLGNHWADSLQIYQLYTVVLGKVSEYGVISINQRSHMTKNMFSKGCGCLDDNLKSTTPIHMKFGK